MVHCYAGVSRSASIVIAYLIQERCMNYVEAIREVKHKRYVICPNDGFRKQLKQFARECYKKRRGKIDKGEDDN